MRQLLAILFICGILLAQNSPAQCATGEVPDCDFVMVLWLDAVVRTRDYESQIEKLPQLSQLLIPAVSIGCLVSDERAIVVISSFSRGRPVDYMTIPRDWAQTIIHLRPAAKEPVAVLPKSEHKH